MTRFLLAACALILATTQVRAEVATNDPQYDRGEAAIHTMTGCYLVDYSYYETESLKPGYTLDHRVYDVDKNQTIKELIYADDISPTRTRLQHVLFAVGLDGKVVDGSLLKHTGEDWEYQPPYIYEFTGPQTWTVRDLSATKGQWVRRITNLDDGLRYQCSAAWNLTTAYPEWSCDSYSPIPGRETRDMGRTDYNTLQRSNRVIVYDTNWLERQDNVKTIDAAGVKTPLAREAGKDWYVRISDSECDDARAFVKPSSPFWTVLRETWDGVLDGKSNFVELNNQKNARFYYIMQLDDKYSTQDLAQPQVRGAAAAEILQVIQKYRQ